MGIKTMGLSAILAFFSSSSIARYAAITAVCLALGFVGGYKLASTFYEADQAKVLADNQKKFEAEVVKNNNLSAQLDSKKGEVDALTNSLNKQAATVITRTVYQHACFDADGLRIANSALTGQSAATSQSH